MHKPWVKIAHECILAMHCYKVNFHLFKEVFTLLELISTDNLFFISCDEM